MPQPLPIRGLNHVARLTKHLEASRAFYRDVLGFREVERPNFNFGGAWLYNYGFMIHLIVDQRIGDTAGEIQTRDEHLAFEVDDVDQVERQLKELGIPYRDNIVPQRNVRQIFFRDPDGHHIEVASYGPTPKEIAPTA